MRVGSCGFAKPQRVRVSQPEEAAGARATIRSITFPLRPPGSRPGPSAAPPPPALHEQRRAARRPAQPPCRVGARGGRGCCGRGSRPGLQRLALAMRSSSSFFLMAKELELPLAALMTSSACRRGGKSVSKNGSRRGGQRAPTAHCVRHISQWFPV
jgi:hypothetical protein